MQAKAFDVTHTDDEWRRLLTPEQYRVMRAHGTEAPGSCALNHEKRPGAFVCAVGTGPFSGVQKIRTRHWLAEF
jgi:peptide-methionine (R)-S-oxide reductase